MKPVGPIPPEFLGQSALEIGGLSVAALVGQGGGTPLFVYDFSVVKARVRGFREAMPGGVALHYAMKANPYAPLLEAIAALVDGFDVASSGELARARKVMPGHRISFAGPGKTDAELQAAIEAGATINLESEGEWSRAQSVAERLGMQPRVAVRVNPDFELRGSGMRMGGRASPFGVDAVRAGALAKRAIEAGALWRGWHIFAGSQSLDSAAIIETHAATIKLAERLADEVGATPPLVNLGGGFGIPYFANDKPVDLEAIGAALGEAVEASPLTRERIEWAIELGRWLVGEAGVYLTRITEKKESQSETFLVVDGGLNHMLAATGNFGMVVRRTYPVAIAERLDGVAEETVSVVGPLCTPLDRLADQAGLPRAGVGDHVAIFAAGAYGPSASPSAFLGHAPAQELLIGAGINS